MLEKPNFSLSAELDTFRTAVPEPLQRPLEPPAPKAAPAIESVVAAPAVGRKSGLGRETKIGLIVIVGLLVLFGGLLAQVRFDRFSGPGSRWRRPAPIVGRNGRPTVGGLAAVKH